MASSINASTSAGLVTSADTSGDLNIQSGGSTKIAVTSAGVAVTGTLSASGVITGDGSGLTNLPAGAAPAALSTATGSAPSYSARAWVNFNGTGTVAIRASGNVSSITDNGTGTYTVNFTNAMSDINYTTNATISQVYAVSNNLALINTNASGEVAPTASAVSVICLSNAGAVADVKYFSVSVFR